MSSNTNKLRNLKFGYKWNRSVSEKGCAHFCKIFKSNIVGIFYLNREIPFEHCIIWNFWWSSSYNCSWNWIFVYGAHMAWALIIQQLTGYFGMFLHFSHFKSRLVYSILLLYFIIFSLIVASFFRHAWSSIHLELNW